VEPARTKAFAWVALAYAVAGVLGYLAAYAVREHDPRVVLAAGYLVSALAIFGFSRAFSNSSFFDAWWMVAPVAALPPLFVDAPVMPRAILVAILVTLWAVRLTWNWIRGWMGLHQEDWRYVDLAAKTGRAYWLVSLTAIHLFPAALVYLGSLSIVVSCLGDAPLGALDVIAALVTLGAIAIEAIADQQLHSFAKSGAPRTATCDVGLWRFSRHPNYFGEMSFWTGLFLFALAAEPGAWWAAIGPVSIIALFVLGTIPMMEKRQLERRKEAYEAYVRRVSMVVPWPPRERASLTDR
jgi:steroid 5-alpha reductase family enzyme